MTDSRTTHLRRDLTTSEIRAIKCHCGHVPANHVNGHGLCLIKSCRPCLAYIPNPASPR